MRDLLNDKVAIVTGGSKGIGKAIVEKFAEFGANVIVISRGIPDFSNLDKSVQDKIKSTSCDIRDEKAIKDLIVQINKKYEHIDVLVNNAGIMQNSLLGMITKQSIYDQFETNVFAVIQLTQIVSRMMRRQKSGSIINMASIIGIKGYEGQTVYSATKGAVVSFTLSASKELASSGIRVNAIAPGTIETDMLKEVSEEKMRMHLEHIKMGRIGKPDEVADLAAFLASDNSKYITGQIIGIDGGTTI